MITFSLVLKGEPGKESSSQEVLLHFSLIELAADGLNVLSVMLTQEKDISPRIPDQIL